jgi:hypothetical protein
MRRSSYIIYLPNPHFSSIHTSLQSTLLFNPHFSSIHTSLQSTLLFNPHFSSAHTSPRNPLPYKPFFAFLSALTKSQISLIKKEKKPDGLKKKDGVAFDVTLELVGGRGLLSKERWKEAWGRLGEREY